MFGIIVLARAEASGGKFNRREHAYCQEFYDSVLFGLLNFVVIEQRVNKRIGFSWPKLDWITRGVLLNSLVNGLVKWGNGFLFQFLRF